MVGYEYAGIAYEKQGKMLAARRRHYVELVLAGMGYAEAARAVGVSKRTGKVWRNGRTRSTGRNGAPCAEWTEAAMPQPKPTGPRYLSMDERIFIADGLVCGLSMSAIASRLGRSRSTVCREVARNRDRGTGRYTPYRAGEMAAARRRRPKPRKLEDRRLAAAVQAKLDVHWIPEQISHWLAAEYPDNKGMNASTETIYQAIYIQAKGQLKRDISQQLRSGRAARRPRTALDARKPRFREPMAIIPERPPEVEDRAVPGHWGGDLITGAASKSAMGTLVERSSRNVILLHLPDGHGSGKVQEAIVRKMARLPKLMRNSLTWDQGSEMALHGKISVALDMDVYFCDPHSPWQRGANENANGLLRQYFPKGTDLSIFPEEYLDAVAEELNDRPRKTLGRRKPSEVFLELMNDSLTA